MAVERDVFGISGPTYLKPIDWNCEHNRRSVAASLVQAVYVLERDRQLSRLSVEALAPAWWEFFHFELIRKLIDDADMSIFGAIFEFNPPSSEEASVANAPRFVIAFRGTITEKDTISRDISLDLHLVQNGLHRTSRFNIAMQAVQNVASVFPGSTIWLAGHSLGAGMAILTGRNMVKKGVFLESFLFNPPFVAAPIERIRDERVKHGFRIARSVITAGLTIAMKAKTEGNSQRSVGEESFSILSSWTPYLFVNPGDHICSEYIGYFQHRKNMEDLGAGFIEKLATQNSIGDLFFKALGWESEPLHLLPSADLIVNVSPSSDFKYAHGISQWWQPELNLQSSKYRYS
ncbi:hypothetical protein BDA96_05G147200 [Sorghum bicolor]|uniref:Fungal lipase-type domain-containing protein n=4 Tax=Sorghum bicolor TaxID=4558 RepID=A0A921QXD9_SORBI|nr:GDSL esterase/lipase At4g10955 [Sorghum bicolor]EES04943.2 hypothetical protein SORBI_3004G129100 [Sorghum bicolor]KAG0530009.1 hypothetical protein BDA96_05G147200 [Sorghum bicolor]|eukprot:XP_021313863.1 GDSL esterase/lipase At4g10955 [Sorghum bicolor]